MPVSLVYAQAAADSHSKMKCQQAGPLAQREEGGGPPQH